MSRSVQPAVATGSRPPTSASDQAREPRWVRPAVVLAVAIGLALLVATLLSWAADGRISGDFSALTTAGRLLRDGHGHELYDLDVQEDTQRQVVGREDSDFFAFMSPPFVGVLYLPGSYLSLHAAYWLTLALVAATVVAAALFAARSGRLSGRARTAFIVVTLASPPAYFALTQTQPSALAVIGVLATLALLRRGDTPAAGLPLALVAVKPQLLLGPILMLAFLRRWRSLGGAAAALVALAVLSAALVGASGIGDWTRLLREVAGESELYGIHADVMASWRGFLSGFGLAHGPTVAAGTLVLLALALLLAGGVWRRAAGMPTSPAALCQAGAMAVFVSLFATPHLHQQDLLLLLVPAVFLLREGQHDSEAGRRARLLLAAGFCLLVLHMAVSAADHSLLVWLLLAGTIVVGRWQRPVGPTSRRPALRVVGCT